MSDFHHTEDFVTGRFEIRRRLGAGGMGVVYEAWDRQRNQLVALKKLLDRDPASIYRLKKEFRSLADVAHPNLVSLYELIEEKGEWFFTMELVQGDSFLEYVRARHSLAEPEDWDGKTLRSTARDPARHAGMLDGAPREEMPGLPPREDRSRCAARVDLLRAVLRELVEGIQALHHAGKLHRDLKPANVLVTPDGRVVLLDFGLVIDVAPSDHVTLAGTPAYMSPEQIVGRAATEASDWYSVGVMVFEALTGEVPFTGSSHSLIVQKQFDDPPAPNEVVTGVPDDLNELCNGLLRRDPASRPKLAEIQRLLGNTPALSHLIDDTPRKGGIPFVGRASELRSLHDAAAAARGGQATVVLIHGRSGLGKSALARHFVEELRGKDSSVLILNGRCYEHESVPYKALDSLIDDLVYYLRHLNALEAKAVLPTDALALARLFPVLEGIEAVKKSRRKVAPIADSQEVRRRAFTALREMMARIADEQTVVLFLDDLQWGDRDSASLVGELLRPPDAPPLLVVGTYRREEAEGSPFLLELNKLQADHAIGELREVALDELQREDAEDLARVVAGGEASPQRVEAIVREAAGSPFFIQELARYAEDVGETGSLDDVIRARVGRLPADAQKALEIVGIAGRPLDAAAAMLAAEVEGDPHPLLATLRAENLVRTRVRDGREEIVTYHDRVREAVVEQMSAQSRKAAHLRLALVLEARSGDPEVLSTHFQRAGELQRAASYAFTAAERAAIALAFNHAAKLYRFAIDVDGIDNAPVARVIDLANALGNAGRSAEAADYYLRAATSVGANEALELRRRASEHQLRSGHVEEGLRVIGEVLASVGMTMPSNPRRAVLGILFRRLMLLIRGLRYRERKEQELPVDLALRVDVCWAATIGLLRIDNIRAAYFQALHLWSALALGDPYRVARALSVEAGLSSIHGGRGKARIDKLLDKSDRHARSLRHPHIEGLTTLAHAACSFYLGRFRDTVRFADDADRILRERCTAVTWEIDTAQNIAISALHYLGELSDLARRIPPLLREAEDRGDHYAATELVVGRPTLFWLASDDAGGAKELVTFLMQRWFVQSFHIQHFKEMFSRAQIDLYQGRFEDAHRRIEERWPALAASMNLRIQFVKIEALHLRARCAVALAGKSGDRKLLAAAERDAKRIYAERMAWALPLAESIRAGVAAVRGDVDTSRALYDNAVRNFEKVEMSLFAATARRRLGEVTGGDAGRELIAAADEWMRARGVKIPERLAHVLTP
jgi:serine/threonine protein kinase